MHVGHCSIPCPGPQQGPSTSWSLSTLAFPCGRPGSFSKKRKCCTKQNVGLTLVEAECQEEEQEDTSYLHGQGDVLLSAAERNRDTPECLRGPVSGSLLGHLYLSPFLAPHHTASSTPQSCGENIQSTGTTAGGNWLIGGRKDESLSQANGGNNPYLQRGLGPCPGCGGQLWVCTPSTDRATLYKEARLEKWAGQQGKYS